MSVASTSAVDEVSPGDVFNNASLELTRTESLDKILKIVKDQFKSETIKLFDGVKKNTPLREKLLSADVERLDLMILITVGLVRGNTLTSIVQTLESTKMKQKLMALRRELKIKNVADGDRSAVTLSRIISAFPDIAINVLRLKIPMIVSYLTVENIYKSFPPVARHHVTAAIIPKKIPKDHIVRILSVILVPFMRTSETVNNKEWKKKSKQENVKTTFDYMMKSYNSPLADEKTRIEWSVDLGILTETKDISPIWREASDSCLTHMKHKYNFDMNKCMDELSTN